MLRRKPNKRVCRITHVQQEPNGCAIACIAMLSGYTYREVLAEYLTLNPAPFNGVNSAEELLLLELFDIDYIQYNFFKRLPFGRCYLVAVPSLTEPGSSHRIILDMRDILSPPVVYDPNAGIEGKQVYTVGMEHDWQVWFSYSEVYEISLWS